MDIRILIKVLGGLLVILGVLLCIPAVFSALSEQTSVMVFLSIAVGSTLLGMLMWNSQRNYRSELNHRTGFAVVTFSWITASFIGALPYFFTNTLPHFLDAFFESVSGFSGTGASVLTFLDGQDRAILLWRSMTQWIGGMGIIVFFIAILPILGLGGVQLFKAEITGPQKDKITPRVRETAKRLWLLYVAFTGVLAVCLWLAGMSGYDALNHAFTTTSTGGFSTHNNGVAHFQSPAIDYILILFMALSSINFSLHYRFLLLRDKAALFSTELKWYLSILLIASLVITFSIWQPHESLLSESFRESLFTVICTASSTGFTNIDYLPWPVGVHFILILLMAMGGMSGSTAGGLKCIRIVASMKQLAKELKQVIHPNAVLTVKADDHSIPANIISAIWGFIFLYFFIFALITLILVYQDLDLISASTATFSALSNIGPAFGSLGPYDNYSELTAVSKTVLCGAMLLGRLEFYTVLVILTPEYWRK
ncbi:MAG: hypothetical protein KDD55_05405 [Bdellovibrionales bacterium]|nr:hypothetical protein [Bdellovibrionales bacterium]